MELRRGKRQAEGGRGMRADEGEETRIMRREEVDGRREKAGWRKDRVGKDKKVGERRRMPGFHRINRF